MAGIAHKVKSKKQNGKSTVTTVRKARQQAKKIINALNEAEQIHQGKRKGKSFDEFLEGL